MSSDGPDLHACFEFMLAINNDDIKTGAPNNKVV